MKTGATRAQIDAAGIVASSHSTCFDWEFDASQDLFVADLTGDMCAALCPPDHRIIDVADLIALLDAAPSEANWAGEVLSDDLRGRIRSSIDGDAE